MVKKLSAEDRNRLKQALGSWERWRPVPKVLPEVITQLGGDSNLSFIVSDGLMRWVLRLNNPLRDVGINRDNERVALQAAHAAGISPLPNFHTSDVLVTPLLTGQQARLENLPQIGVLFSQIHSLAIELTPINLIQHLKNYYEKAAPEPLLKDCYQHILDLYPKESVDLKPCHNDCLLPNMIESEHGLYIIDWEYAAAADPAYDLAVFSSTYELNQTQLRSLLSVYDPGSVLDTESQMSRIKYYEKYYRLIEILWWSVRGRSMEAELEALAESLG
jgi:thiamine kinase